MHRILALAAILCFWTSPLLAQTRPPQTKPANKPTTPVVPIRVDKPITITFFPLPTMTKPITFPIPVPTTPNIPITFPIPIPTTPNIPVTFPIPTPINPITTPSTTPPLTRPTNPSARDVELKVAANIQKYMGMHVSVRGVEVDMAKKTVSVKGFIRDSRYEAQLTRMLKNLPELRDYEIFLFMDVVK
jgi:hypothetical protein